MQTLTRRARERLIAGEQELADALDAVLDESLENSQEPIGLSVERELRAKLAENLAGFGPLQPLLADPEIEELWINSTSSVFVARNGRTEKLEIEIPQIQLASLVEKMLRHTGRRLDRTSPFVDASLPDGSRLHVVIPEITRDHWSINIRKFPNRILTLQNLVGLGSLSEIEARFLSEQVVAGKNFLVSGATQAGKTTLLCALLDEIAVRKRIISVEETFEIRTRARDWVAMQTRQSNLEGIGEVSLRRLVKEALRMRPEVIVVGEVREAESFDLLIALNSGLPGLCTIHANSSADAIQKLCTLPLLAGSNIRSEFVDQAVANCIDLVVHCEMQINGKRRIAQISKVEWDPYSARPKVIGIEL